MPECPNCGAEVNSSDKRCTKCGKELKKNYNKLLIVIIIAVIVVAIFGIFASGILSTDSNTGSKATNNDDSQSYSSNAVFWASKNATKFHKPNCQWAQKINPDNKIVYHSREDAINDGREPCGECNP